MSTHGRARARRRPVRTGAAGRRRRGYQDALIARRRIMPRPVNLPEMQMLARLSLLFVEPPSQALN